MQHPASNEWNVVVVLPAESRYARVARTTAATCAVLEGFDVDRLGDVRLLVDEVFVTLLGTGARRVELRVAVGDRRISLELLAFHDDSQARTIAGTGVVRELADVLATDVTVALDQVPPRFVATVAAR